MTVDGKRLVMDYLRAHPAVSAITQSVRSTMPDETEEPWILGTQIHRANEAEPARHLYSHALQFDCYAGKDPDNKPGWPEANKLGYAVADALEALEGTQDGAVVSVAYVRGPWESADPDFKPTARARTIVEADVYLHP
jgi:hypothetical protein